mmetsp:Transcript_76041/g.211316  ORF Transcript_76041/g.211316 Transcript_76041/m.211316 type:complete len:206 (-) Transcript_76041:1416-2033(-)
MLRSSFHACTLASCRLTLSPPRARRSYAAVAWRAAKVMARAKNSSFWRLPTHCRSGTRRCRRRAKALSCLLRSSPEAAALSSTRLAGPRGARRSLQTSGGSCCSASTSLALVTAYALRRQTAWRFSAWSPAWPMGVYVLTPRWSRRTRLLCMVSACNDRCYPCSSSTEALVRIGSAPMRRNSTVLMASRSKAAISVSASCSLWPL